MTIAILYFLNYQSYKIIHKNIKSFQTNLEVWEWFLWLLTKIKTGANSAKAPKAHTGPIGLQQRQMAPDRQVKQDYEGGACSAPNLLAFKKYFSTKYIYF